LPQSSLLFDLSLLLGLHGSYDILLLQGEKSFPLGFNQIAMSEGEEVNFLLSFLLFDLLISLLISLHKAFVSFQNSLPLCFAVLCPLFYFLDYLLVCFLNLCLFRLNEFLFFSFAGNGSLIDLLPKSAAQVLKLRVVEHNSSSETVAIFPLEKGLKGWVAWL
jgi:hypothetical protein